MSMFSRVLRYLLSANGTTGIEVERTANDNTVRIKTAGVDRAEFLPTGECGFPTASSGYRMRASGGLSGATQGGFYADSTLTSGTANHAFRGAIAYGTGRYNLYMDGSASNYFAGNLGIGTTPSFVLDVSAGSLPSTVNSETVLSRLSATTTNSNAVYTKHIRHTAGSDWSTVATRIQMQVDASKQGYVEFNPQGGTSGLALGVANSEAMRVTSGKLVGIGTPNPAALLHLESALAYQPQLILRNISADATGGYWNSEKSRAGAAVQPGDSLGTFVFRGTDTGSVFRNAGYFEAKAVSVSAGVVSSSLRLYTVNSAGAGNGGLFISDSGKVSIGTGVAATAPLQVANTPVYADNTTALAGGLTAGAFYRTAVGVSMIVF